MSYLERYLAGEREAVWGELIGLGDDVRTPPLLDEALAVAHEIARRAKHNIGLLHRRLLDLGYEFADPEAAFKLAGPEEVEQIGEVERQLGTLPLFVRVWYGSMASVDFSQAKAQLVGPTDSEVGGLGAHPDVMMQSLRVCLATRVEWAAETKRQLAYLKANIPEEDYLFYEKDWNDSGSTAQFLPTGGAASNCDSQGFSLPCLGIDGLLYDDGSGGMYLVPYLRMCFKWGGFPLCATWAAGTKPFSWLARPDWERVIPLLREGLLEI